MTWIRIAAVLVLVVVATVGVSACSSPEPEAEVVVAWPAATSERTVPEPPEPTRWPLTGLAAPSPEAVLVRVVSVKVENSPDARPQTNLQRADVVYESVTEGGITRFNALFHSDAPDVVGPVRSARLSDTYIVPQYQALFSFSGASSSVNAAVRSAGIENLSEDAGVTKPFTRSSNRPRPHNLYLDVVEARAEGERRGMDTQREITGLQYDTARVTQVLPPSVTRISIPFSTANNVEWTYDSDRRVYLRVNNRAPFNDAGTGEQVYARNVVVMWAQHRVATSNSAGTVTYEIILAGSGKASVFRDGQRFDGTWEAGADAPPRFIAEDGTPITLAPGNTWMQVVNTSVGLTAQ
jgi:hypothetical protein